MTKAERTKQFIIEQAAPVYSIRGIAGTNGIKQDKLPMASPRKVRHAPVAGKDLARTIVTIMGEPEKHANIRARDTGS